jgi:hypothetical protein
VRRTRALADPVANTLTVTEYATLIHCLQSEENRYGRDERGARFRVQGEGFEGCI